MPIVTNNSGVTRDTQEIVPTVGMAGYFTLSAPYTALVREMVEYTVTGVISIAGAIADGLDPLNDIYLEHGDTEANFNIDAAANHCLVTMQSGEGDVVTVPNSSLILIPQADGVPYSNVVLGISLSAIPEDLDLTALETELSDLIFDRIGVRSTVFSTTVGGTSILTHDQHAAVEAARVANIESDLSMRTQNTQLQDINAALIVRLARLEEYVKGTLPP